MARPEIDLAKVFDKIYVKSLEGVLVSLGRGIGIPGRGYLYPWEGVLVSLERGIGIPGKWYWHPWEGVLASLVPPVSTTNIFQKNIPSVA